MSTLHFHRSRRPGSDDDKPFEFRIVNIGDEFDTLDIATHSVLVTLMSVTREELVACRDVINAHLGEKSQTEIVSDVEDSITAVCGYIHDARLRGDGEDRRGKEKYRAGLRAATLIAIGPEGGAEEGR